MECRGNSFKGRREKDEKGNIRENFFKKMLFKPTVVPDYIFLELKRRSFKNIEWKDYRSQVLVIQELYIITKIGK